MKIFQFYMEKPQSYTGSGCSKCSCKKFVISNDPQFCDNCGHPRSAHYGM